MKKIRILAVGVLIAMCLFTSCKNEVSGGGTIDSSTVYPIEGQGLVDKTGISINGDAELEKTTEIVVIPKGKTATIHMTDDSSWSTYYDGTYDYYKGVFIKDRSVTLSPYAISAYQVTQELYEAVMGTNPSYYQGDSEQPATGETQKYRPVEYVTWYDAVRFCNELTKKTMSESDCVYAFTDIEYYNAEQKKYIKSANVTIDITKKGYRLPTEAEWEFAARGGDPTAEDWKFAYSGVQTKKSASMFTDSPYNDEELENYGWYGYLVNEAENNFFGTHEVGTKKPNKLGLYDMSGNVWEWCNDKYNGIVTENDEAYKVGDTIKNPLGSASGSYRVNRSGFWSYYAEYCSVSYRSYYYPVTHNYNIGFRLARSL